MQTKTEESNFRVRFARPVRADELVELRFASTVYVNGTRFDAFLHHSELAIRQGVQSGDATERVESSSHVVGFPQGGNIIANLSLVPNVLTPNGDDVHDELVIALDLVDVLEGRPLRVQIFDLAGRSVWSTQEMVVAGEHRLVWPGHDAQGRVVPPGHYLLHIGFEGDARIQTSTRLLPVVY